MKASEMIKELSKYPDFEVCMSEENIDYINKKVNVSKYSIIDICDIEHYNKLIVFDVKKEGN